MPWRERSGWDIGTNGRTFFKAGIALVIFGVEIFGDMFSVFPWGGFAFGWTF